MGTKKLPLNSDIGSGLVPVNCLKNILDYCPKAVMIRHCLVVIKSFTQTKDPGL